MADDQLTAALAEIREREAKASPGPWKVSRDRGYDMDGMPWSLPSVTGPDGRDILAGYADQPGADLRFAADARADVPLLLAAVDAVLALHRPVLNVMYEGDRCTGCKDEFGDPVPFAECRARKAALAALTGKAAS